MGYYTEYKLTARKIKNNEQFNQLVAALTDKDIFNYALLKGDFDERTHEAFFDTYEAVKWYTHVEDMISIAETFPNIYFELEGAGEEMGDFWKEYYHDMDVETCRGEIVYEQPKKVQWSDLIVF